MTIGVLGAGQLGRMMALAGYPLGQDFLFLDREPGTPSHQVAPSLFGDFSDPALLDDLASRCEVVTFDWENVPAAALERLELRVRIAPPRAALATAQDRLAEKTLFRELSIPTNRTQAVDSLAGLHAAVTTIGLPGVLKTRRLGYDGKGQCVLRKAADIEAAWQQLGSAPLLYEEMVPFDYEVSVIGVRGLTGEIAHLSAQPQPAPRRHPASDPRSVARAEARAGREAVHDPCAEAFQLRGCAGHGILRLSWPLLANEMAPRVHNSGHWTIEGAATSQFENHLRAITGLPLGDTRARGHSAMLNLIGRMPDRTALLKEKNLHLHDYGKSPREGRKLGHCTVVETSATAADQRAATLLRRIESRKI